MILILAKEHDSTVDQVERMLRQRGAGVLRFDDAHFPRLARVSLTYSDSGRPCGALETQGVRYDLADFSSVWEHKRGVYPICRVSDPVAVPAGNSRGMTKRFVENESTRFIEDVWQTLECRWLPAPEATVRRVEEKLLQTKVAHELGFNLPPSLITNDPQEFLEFYREHNGRIISKVFHRKMFPPEMDGEQAFRVFTEIVSSRAVGYSASIRYSPAIFQAYVPKLTELRVTIVGRRVFAAEIFSQQSHHTQHDWRRYDPAHTPYRRHQLPADMERRCIALLDRLGLSFGAVDLVLTPDGRYVFLEINPRGEWQWIEVATGMPIAQAVCDYLEGVSYGNAN